MNQHLHPFGGIRSAFAELCDLADEHGWKVLLQLVDADGTPIPHSQLAAERLGSRPESCRRQVTLVGGGFVLRAVENGHGAAALDELAERVLVKVVPA